MSKKKIDPNLLSCCWLLCEACNQFKNGECPGCKSLNKTPGWCTIRDCCLKNGYTNCSECREFIENEGCKKFDSMVAGCLKFLDESERSAIAEIIKDKGLKGYIKYRSEQKLSGNK